MKEKDINELNSIELMKAIYKEIIEIKENANKVNDKKIDNLSNNLNDMNNKVDSLSANFNEMSNKVDGLSNKFNEMSNRVDSLSNNFNNMSNKVDNLSNNFNNMKKDIKDIQSILKVHTDKFKQHDEKFESLESKVDKIGDKLDNLDKIERLHFEYTRNKFSRLDKKIESNFSCLNNKIDNETEERKVDISRLETFKEFDKIVLNDFGSRISILEEESEKYNLN